MEFSMYSSLQLPRRKIYLSSLRELLQNEPILQPQITIRQKIFPQTKLSNGNNMAKRAQSSIQLNKLKNKASRSQNKIINQPSSKFKKIGTEKQNKSSRQQANKLKISSLEGMSMQFSLSQQLPSKTLTNFGSYGGKTDHKHYQSIQLDQSKRQRQFLRKGSSVQKQVVINLLRSKLLRQRQQNQKRQYNNKQIIKMINIFKGVSSQTDNYTKTSIQGDHNRSRQNFKREMIRQLKGWDYEQYQDHYDQQQKR